MFPWYFWFSWRDFYLRLLHSIVFLYLFALITEEGFLISPCYSLQLCIQINIAFLFSFAFSIFSQLFIRQPQTTILPFCISFPWGWSCHCLLHNVTNLLHSDKMWSTGEENGEPLSILALRTPWTARKGSKRGHWKRNSPGWKMPNMLLEESGEITPARMKRRSQSEKYASCGCDWWWK